MSYSLFKIISKVATPAAEYFSARSRTASLESQASEPVFALSPLKEDGKRSTIMVSNNQKREHKDRRIYVNCRTGLPVRPPTSFGLFKHAMRRSIKKGEKVDFVEFNKKSNEQWAKLSEQEKEPYIQRAKELAQQYKKIEVFYLRKKVRQLENELGDY